MTDTIFALSSGAPPAAIAIMRLSGPAALAIASGLAGDLPAPRRAALRGLRDPRDGTLLDRALVVMFPGPHSATGEDLVELHLHGGRAVVAAVEAAIGSDRRARQAEAGEFTRRALENGVIDLTAAEGLGDLLAAQTESQRRAALAMTEGGVQALVGDWAARLIDIAAAIEAELDFSDEDDVVTQGSSIASLRAAIKILADEIGRLLDAPMVERLHRGISVVIAGPPNSGKSTLINQLAERDVAIVSSISGTTRDRIEAAVVRSGGLYLLADTAGLTASPGDEIERIGIERARQAMDTADILLWLGDEAPPTAHAESIWVLPRCDQLGREAVTASNGRIAVSAHSGFGIEALWEQIGACAAHLLPREDVVAVNRRQHRLLRECHGHLAASHGTDLLILAEEVRKALGSLDAITGRAGVDDLLDSIFARFCIGK